MKPPPVADPDVRAVYDAYDPALRKSLMAVRRIMYAAAAGTPDVGPLIETLKWGQISYLPAKPRIGTTVRIDKAADPESGVALFFHCQTNLLDTFRERYPDIFVYIGNRSMELRHDWKAHTGELQHCVGLALSYHVWKSKPR